MAEAVDIFPGRSAMKRTLFAVLLLGLGYTSSAHAQLAHAQPEWYLPTGDGCQLFVQEFGQGPETVVVLHGGWGAEHSYLLDAFRGLDEMYHLVFYDQRGSLLSPCPAEKISIQKHVDDLELLRATLGLGQINIVAHSMGTFLAMNYLQRYPEKVKGVVLFGALPPRTPKDDPEKKLLEEQQRESHTFIERPEIAAELHRLGLDRDDSALSAQQRSSAWHIRFGAVNAYHLDRWQYVKGGRAYYNQQSADAAAKTMPQEWDFTPALAARHCATWVINGDHDYADPAAKFFQQVTSSVPGVRIVVLKDAGHSAWVDAPEDFAKAMSKALESTTQCH